MNYPQVARSLRDALALTQDQMAECFNAGGQPVSADEVPELLEGLSKVEFVILLDGLIAVRRGPGPPRPRVQRVNNNVVLKKLRIALNLHEEDILRIFAAGGVSLDSRELTPMFRKQGSKNYKTCSDEMLAAFFAGLSKPNKRWPD
jgi:uncharacterized protein YehS (DUF1456 family)